MVQVGIYIPWLLFEGGFQQRQGFSFCFTGGNKPFVAVVFHAKRREFKHNCDSRGTTAQKNEQMRQHKRNTDINTGLVPTQLPLFGNNAIHNNAISNKSGQQNSQVLHQHFLVSSLCILIWGEKKRSDTYEETWEVRPGSRQLSREIVGKRSADSGHTGSYDSSCAYTSWGSLTFGCWFFSAIWRSVSFVYSFALNRTCRNLQEFQDDVGVVLGMQQTFSFKAPLRAGLASLRSWRFFNGWIHCRSLAEIARVLLSCFWILVLHLTVVSKVLGSDHVSLSVCQLPGLV